MKKSKNMKSVEALQRSADKRGVRLQQANATSDMTDAGVVERLLKKGLKDREPIM